MADGSLDAHLIVGAIERMEHRLGEKIDGQSEKVDELIGMAKAQTVVITSLYGSSERQIEVMEHQTKTIEHQAKMIERMDDRLGKKIDGQTEELRNLVQLTEGMLKRAEIRVTD